MGYYGILKSNVNTGLESELVATFAAPLNLIDNAPEYSSDTMNLQQAVASQNVQRWELESMIVPTNDSVSFIVHNIRSAGGKKIFIRMPQVYRPDKMKTTLNKNFQVKANVAAGQSQVRIKESSNAKFVDGEFINFLGDNKVYLITDANVSSDTIEIYPPLRSAKLINTNITYGDKVTLVARYSHDNIRGMRYKDGILADPGSVRFIEALG